MAFFVLAVTSLLFTSGKEPEVRKINPPQLNAENVGKKVLCHRPLRKGGPRLELEEINGKTIGHIYGHRGSGCTLGPGSAKYVVGLLDQKMASRKVLKDEPITVIGAGIIGLMSALELKHLGYTNVKIVAASFENLTSHNAGGQFAPVYMGNDPDKQALMDAIGVVSYNYYKDIILGKHPYLKRGATLVTDYFENLEDFGLEPFVAAGAMQPAKTVILDFQNGTTRKMYAYDDCIYMDMPIMLQDIRDVLENLGVSFEQRSITSFGDIQDAYILNCAGLGAKALTGDEQLISVQGHLLMLKNQNPDDVNYMIEVYIGKRKTSTDMPMTEAFYIFPKRLPGSLPGDIGVLGGTYIENATPEIPHEEEFDLILQNAKVFYGIK